MLLPLILPLIPLLILGVIVFVAFRRRTNFTRILAVSLLVGGLVLREFVLVSWVRASLGGARIVSPSIAAYQEGVSALRQFCDYSSLIVVASAVILIALSVWVGRGEA